MLERDQVRQVASEDMKTQRQRQGDDNREIYILVIGALLKCYYPPWDKTGSHLKQCPVR
jgi:hypothetical protein